MQSDAPQPETVEQQARQVEHDGQALLAVFLQSVSSVEGRVSPAQLRALGLLRDRGPLNLGDLADGLGVRPSSATRLCDRLSAAGLLVRQVAPHSRREVVLSLNRAGTDLLVELERRRQEEVAGLLAAMPRAERACLVSGLAAFARAGARGEDDLPLSRV